MIKERIIIGVHRHKVGWIEIMLVIGGGWL